MMLVKNLQPYTGIETAQHKGAKARLGIGNNEAHCYKGSINGRNIFVLMRENLNPNQKGGAQIVFWQEGVHRLRLSSIFKHGSSGGHQILE